MADTSPSHLFLLSFPPSCVPLPYTHTQLSLYQTMASIYHSIGFHRKAAMFTLYAARHANKLAGELPEEPKLAKPNQMQLIHKVN